jgi:hypothetical protein
MVTTTEQQMDTTIEGPATRQALAQELTRSEISAAQSYDTMVSDLAEAKARLADIAHGATVSLEGRSCFSAQWILREIKRVAEAPL